MTTHLPNLIAKAIREADTSWFNEDYTRQAMKVLEALNRKGLEICPKEAPEGLITYAVDNLPFGRMKPEDLIRELYRILVANARKFE